MKLLRPPETRGVLMQRGLLLRRIPGVRLLFLQKANEKEEEERKENFFALFDEETGAWWYSDADESFEPEEGHSCAILCS